MKFKALVSNPKYLYDENCVEREISFPASDEELKNTLEELGIDKNVIFVSGLKLPVENLGDLFYGLFNLDHINAITSKLSEFTNEQFDILSAIDELEGIRYLDEFEDIIDHIDDYEILPDIRSDEELAEYFIEEISAEDLRAYVNCRQLGHDIRATLDAGHTKLGCLVNNR